MLHETARHAIHSFETLSALVETLEAMQQQAVDLSSKTKQRSGELKEASRQVQVHIDFQIRILRSLFLRSQSNKERLQNEITLVGVNMLTAKADTNILLGVQLDRPARQSGNDGLRRSGEA
jgi:hypothetical protein